MIWNIEIFLPKLHDDFYPTQAQSLPCQFLPFFKLDLSWHDKLLNGFVKNTDCIYPFPEMNFEKKFVPSAAKCSHIPIVLTPTRCFLFLIFSFILHQPLYGKYLRLNGFHGLLRWWFQDYPIKPQCGLIMIANLNKLNASHRRHQFPLPNFLWSSEVMPTAILRSELNTCRILWGVHIIKD